MMKWLRSMFGWRSWYGHGGYLEILRVAYPLVIMCASNTVMQFVDRKFLAANSTLDVAAALPSGVLYFTMFCFFMVTCNFTSALVAQLVGSGDRRGVLTAVWSGFQLAVIAGVLLTFVLPFLGAWLITLGDHPPELMAREKEYFQALLPSGVFVCFGAPFFAFFSGRGKTVPVAVINSAACLLNILLDYVFIFGKWGVPAMGIFGAGIATSLCSFCSMAAIMICFLCVDQRKYPTRRHWRGSWSYFRKLWLFGTPAGLQCLFDTGSFTLVTFLIAALGTDALAATVIALSVNNMFFIPLTGLADATSIVVAQNIGRERANTACAAAFRAWRISAAYMLLGAIVYTVFPVQLAEFFSPQDRSGDYARIVEICRWIFLMAVFFNSFDAVKFVFMGALRGAGDTRAIFLITTCCAWCGLVPIAFLFTRVWPLPVVQFWMVLTAYYVVEAILMVWRFRSGKWRQIRLVHTRTEVRAEAEGTAKKYRIA